MLNWYYADRDRQRHGPMDGAALAQHFRDGRIGLDALVWRDGMAQWQPLGELAGELGLLADAPPLPGRAVDPPTSLATEATPDGRAVFTASEPAYQAQRDADAFATATASADNRSPYSAPSAALIGHGHVVLGGEVVYAGFWKRVAAYVIDAFVVGLVGGIIGAIIGGIMGAAFGLGGGMESGGLLAIQIVVQLVSQALTACYYAYFHSSNNQATLGKMAVGIKVVNNVGEPISFARGIGRYFALILSSLTLCIGFIMAGFTERKRALHDMICGTLVVDRWAFTDQPELQRHELGGVTIAILIIFGLLALLGVVLVAVMIAAIGSGLGR
ncbi:RDD family protein [Pseudoxanthomonas sp.]|uniref:RDD family protein n=1 Tax=Pseudoxanthomonas sp. TaxID=1871049 RepID=UPI002630C444|nr:RDD family protein [Pseudoxanthomonas sp.]WDS37848.1 MAG: RDD family protein [Pseudoxanthomonas sp.]